jgi:CheY-like chemotaxis protein
MGEKLTILLCEDDENLGMLLREYLNAKGYNAELCPDGEAGYKAFLKNKYDLCVFDVMMPKMDGFTLAQEIRKVNTEIPIIFLTAKTLKEDVLEGFKIGAIFEIGLGIGHHIALGYGGYIEARSAHKERSFAPGNDIVDGFIGQSLEVVHGEEVVGLSHINQMMGNPLHFLGGDLATTQIEAAENLTGIGGDDFTAVVLGELYAQTTLSGGVGSCDDDELWFHV